MSRRGIFEGTSDNDIIVSRAIRSRKLELNRKHTFQTSEAAAEEVPTVVEPCEKPTPTGWSMNNLWRSVSTVSSERSSHDNAFLHVGNFVPCGRVQADSSGVVVNPAWSKFLE